jgi:hypothetical protein
MNCTHEFKMYEGFTDTFEYCVKCDAKKADCDSKNDTSIRGLLPGEMMIPGGWLRPQDLKYKPFKLNMAEPEEESFNITKLKFLEAVSPAYTRGRHFTKFLDFDLALEIWEKIEADANGEPDSE